MEMPEFKKVMRGYDPEAVDQAWAESARQLSEAQAMNKELRLQINSLREQNTEWGLRLKNYEQVEKDLRDALLSAQRIANQVKDDAEREAEVLLQSVRSESDLLLREAKQTAEALETETANLLVEKRLEIAEIDEQILGMAEQKKVLQIQVEQAMHYLERVKELLFTSVPADVSKEVLEE